MIVAGNPKPSLQEFGDLMRCVDMALNADAVKRPSYYAGHNGTRLEADVRDAAVECAKNTKFEGTIELVSGSSFPDIVAAKHYGIEVKSTKSNHWKSIGSSILESTRISDVERIFLTFGKLGDPVEFRSRPYEECLSGIAVTHYPRYQIDMTLAQGDTIFEKMGVSYEEFRMMSNPVEPVSKYYRSQLRHGESLWWAGDRIDTAVPMTVRLWKTLSSAEKDELEAAIYIYFPETIMSSCRQEKYDRATLWLATEKGIINANVRDSFSAGGRNLMETADGGQIWMPAVFKKISDHIRNIAEVISGTPEEVLSEKWGCAVGDDRARQWIELVINASDDLNGRIDARAVLEKILADNGLLG